MEKIHALTLRVMLVQHTLSIHCHVQHTDADPHGPKAEQDNWKCSTKTNQTKSRSGNDGSNTQHHSAAHFSNKRRAASQSD